MISVGFGRRAVARLGAEGVPVVYREYPMAHQVSMESMRDSMTWLALVLAGERPTEPVPDFAALRGLDLGGVSAGRLLLLGQQGPEALLGPADQVAGGAAEAGRNRRSPRSAGCSARTAGSRR